MSTTKYGRPLFTYKATCTRLDTFDRLIEEKIEIKAVNEYQAKIIAAGVAKKNGWKFQSVGRA